jgi:hypothetical protein
VEDDIAQIAGWGFDHVRLPIDYPVLESDDAPGVYREDGFAYVDACLEWCQRRGLGLILDLHHAPGYSFANTLRPETEPLNVLFHEEAAQQRFSGLWRAIATRYRAAGADVIFELLNEVVLPDSEPWNRLVARTVAELRPVVPEGRIMVGGNQYGAASELEHLAVLEDANVVYTFHFYEPLLFTHQKASWTRVCREYDQTLDYPGTFTGLGEFLARAPEHRAGFGWQAGRALDRGLVLEFMRPALAFRAQVPAPLYCGEFGVIEHAPVAGRARWIADVIAVLAAHQIGWALWSYKSMSFGVVDRAGQVQDEAVLAVLRG